jgi:hypothetical protein
VNTVTTGANCQLVAASPQLNGGNMAPPSMTKRLPLYYLLSYSLSALDSTGRVGECAVSWPRAWASYR